MEKSGIREEMKKRRLGLTADEVRRFSDAVQSKVLQMDCFMKARHVMAYMPFANEVDSLTILEAAARMRKAIYLPRVKDGTIMEAIPLDFPATQLVKSRFGVSEPPAGLQPADPSIIDLVIVPGLAFDVSGNRIGFGKGYYDRFMRLLRLDCTKVALAYDFQTAERIPAETYDVRVHRIVTEKRIIECEDSYHAGET